MTSPYLKWKWKCGAERVVSVSELVDMYCVIVWYVREKLSDANLFEQTDSEDWIEEKS